MANTTSTMSSPKNQKKSEFSLHLKRQLRVFGAILFSILTLYTPTASAALAADGLCEFASYLKIIATTAAVIALILFVMNSFFIKSSVIGDIILYVIIGCVIIAGGTEVIDLTGLSSTCSL